MNKWVLLMYRIPREPTALRVSVWRKLKQLGAVLLQDGVWVLPANPRTQEQFQWLAAEVVELGGEATLWCAELTTESQSAALVEQFVTRTDAAYRAILDELKQPAVDRAAVSRRYQQTLARDYFESKLGERVRAALSAARRGERS
ncbi:MAG: ChrB protein [Planctomycetes bacterium]|nr:ChrB protein [Planctomycetota bacterium]